MTEKALLYLPVIENSSKMRVLVCFVAVVAVAIVAVAIVAVAVC